MFQTLQDTLQNDERFLSGGNLQKNMDLKYANKFYKATLRPIYQIDMPYLKDLSDYFINTNLCIQRAKL